MANQKTRRYLIEGEAFSRSDLERARCITGELNGVGKSANFRVLGQTGLKPLFFDIEYDHVADQQVCYVTDLLVPWLATVGRGGIVSAGESNTVTRAVRTMISHTTDNHVHSIEEGFEVNFYGTHDGPKYGDWSCTCPLHLTTVYRPCRGVDGVRRFQEFPIGLNPVSFVEFIRSERPVKGLGGIGRAALERWANAVDEELDDFDYYRRLC